MAALRKHTLSTAPDAQPADAAPEALAPDAIATKVVLVSADAAAAHVASPARGLQDALVDRLNAESFGADYSSRRDDTRKYPFKWTLIGVTVISLAAWIGIARLIFQ